MQRKTQKFLNRTDRVLDVVKRLKECWPLYHGTFFDCSIMLSLLKPEMGTWGIVSWLKSVRFRK